MLLARVVLVDAMVRARKLARKNSGCRLASCQLSASVIVPVGAADKNSTHLGVWGSRYSSKIPVGTDVSLLSDRFNITWSILGYHACIAISDIKHGKILTELLRVSRLRWIIRLLPLLSGINVHISWRRISWCYVILSLGAAIFYTERGHFFWEDVLYKEKVNDILWI